VLECLEILDGKGPADLRELTVELASHMLVLGEKSSSVSAARAMARQALQSGAAREKFSEMCRAQGASVDVFDRREALAVHSHTLEILAPRAGYVSRIDGEQLGLSVVDLGGGRHKANDSIDYGVGMRLHAKLGQAVKAGQPLVTVHYNPERLRTEEIDHEDIRCRVAAALSVGTQKTKAPDLLKKVIE